MIRKKISLSYKNIYSFLLLAVTFALASQSGEYIEPYYYNGYPIAVSEDNFTINFSIMDTIAVKLGAELLNESKKSRHYIIGNQLLPILEYSVYFDSVSTNHDRPYKFFGNIFYLSRGEKLFFLMFKTSTPQLSRFLYSAYFQEFDPNYKSQITDYYPYKKEINFKSFKKRTLICPGFGAQYLINNNILSGWPKYLSWLGYSLDVLFVAAVSIDVTRGSNSSILLGAASMALYRLLSIYGGKNDIQIIDIIFNSGYKIPANINE